MTPTAREAIAADLRRRRAAVLARVAHTEDDLRLIGEHRESELEERGQEERLGRLLARLDDRGCRELDEIDAALRRLLDGSFGRCAACGGRIAAARLRALPTATRCLACARREESGQPALEDARDEAALADESPPSDRELEEELVERVRRDRRIDLQELRIVCREGVVHLEGVLPSEAEHHVLRQIVRDVEGVEDVVDHVRIDPLAWERADRPPRTTAGRALRGVEPIGTDDVVRSGEEGLDYLAPDAPTGDEDED